MNELYEINYLDIEENEKYEKIIDKVIKKCFEICPRQALHAKTLGFEHPRTHERMFFNSELPEDFASLLKKWEEIV